MLKKLPDFDVGRCNFCFSILTWHTFRKLECGPYNGFACCGYCKIKLEKIAKDLDLKTAPRVLWGGVGTTRLPRKTKSSI